MAAKKSIAVRQFDNPRFDKINPNNTPNERQYLYRVFSAKNVTWPVIGTVLDGTSINRLIEEDYYEVSITALEDR